MNFFLNYVFFLVSSLFGILCHPVVQRQMHITFIIFFIFVLSVPDSVCRGGSAGGGHSSHSSGSHSTVISGPARGSYSPPPPPPPPPCQAVTASVSGNILRDRPCVDTAPCLVVVNSTANTSDLCLAWSPYSFWDGSSCVCRCELLGGKMDTSAVAPTITCSLNGIGLKIYNKTTSEAKLYLAPIQCGVWLGARDSAWDKSWFGSGCFSILDNRFAKNPVSVRECGVDRFTTGCRFLDTSQRWVPNCRESNLTECGVQVVCPVQNPCGLGLDIDTNLDNKFATCAAKTHLALNVSADETNCYLWNPHAFLLDGYCVSACGRLDNQCILNGIHVPPCNTIRSFQDDSVVSISPEICSVPMPPDTYAGFRNGFYGMSRIENSKCLVTPNCTSLVMCFKIEGLDITPLSYALSSDIPLCMGNLSQRCKIEYPCPLPDTPFQCSSGVLGISEAIYTRFGVYSCPWFSVRDGFIIFLWACSFLGSCVWLGNDDTAKKYHLSHLGTCEFIFLYLLVASFWVGVSCVWDFAAPPMILLKFLNSVFPRAFGVFNFHTQYKALDTEKNEQQDPILKNGQDVAAFSMSDEVVFTRPGDRVGSTANVVKTRKR